MPHGSDNVAHQAVLDELRRSALDTYGEERIGEAIVQATLLTTATALWRVSQESLDPHGPEPLPTHD
jgi:hypothetical protein